MLHWCVKSEHEAETLFIPVMASLTLATGMLALVNMDNFTGTKTKPILVKALVLTNCVNWQVNVIAV